MYIWINCIFLYIYIFMKYEAVATIKHTGLRINMNKREDRFTVEP